MIDPAKPCKVCSVEKPLGDYWKDKTHADGHWSTCKVCACAAARDRLKGSDAKASSTMATLRYRLKSYGMTVEQYSDLFNPIAYCAICDVELHPVWAEVPLMDKAVVDHNHKTGAFRALLCRHCNTGLGSFKDSVSLLELAADYLRRNNG